jgi:hypothetical protein
METTQIMISELSNGHQISINGKNKIVVDTNWTHVYIRDSEDRFGEITSFIKSRELISLVNPFA